LLLVKECVGFECLCIKLEAFLFFVESEFKMLLETLGVGLATVGGDTKFDFNAGFALIFKLLKVFSVESEFCLGLVDFK